MELGDDDDDDVVVGEEDEFALVFVFVFGVMVLFFQFNSIQFNSIQFVLVLQWKRK